MMILLGVLTFALLVIVHEYGHFIVARRNGVEVEEFGIGFPPRLFGKKVGETLYSFNLIPLGGFVKLKGESDDDSGTGTFGDARLWVKSKILLAGVGMNVIAAFVMILILAWTSLPQILPNQYRFDVDETITSQGVVITQVAEGSVAAEGGVEVGDEVRRIDGHDIATAEEFIEITDQLAGEELSFMLQRGGEMIELDLRLEEVSDGAQRSVEPAELSTSRYTWGAPIVAAGITLQMIVMVLVAVWDILVGLASGAGGEAAEQLAGPVGIVFLLQNLGDIGLEYLFFLLASISVSLAVFNALPIPALDGGRLAVIAGSRMLRKRLDPAVENAIHGIGFLFLIGLLILITYVDVQRFF